MALSIYHTTIFHESAIWLTWLTSWNYLLCLVYYLTTFALHLRHYMTSSLDDNNKSEIGWREKLYWFLYTSSFIVCLTVATLFWPLLSNGSSRGGARGLFIAIDRHGINFVLLLFEFVVNKIPVRIYHYIHPFGFFAVYMAFNGFYFEITGLLIYKLIDWASGYTSIIVIVVAVFSLLLQFLFYFIDYLKRRFIAKEGSDDDYNIGVNYGSTEIHRINNGFEP